MAAPSQGLSQVQKQTQNLVLAPQLRQSLKILQVPALDLRTVILEELQTNPLLEELPGAEASLEEELGDGGSEESSEEVSPDSVSETDDQIETDIAEPSEVTEDLELADPADPDELAFADEFAVLNEMQEDLREHFEQEYEGDYQLSNPEAENKRKFFFDSLVSETSLQEHLLGQLRLTDSTSGQRRTIEYLIGSLDEKGFIVGSLSDLALLAGLPLKDMQAGLEVLRAFDPPGIASTDLRDCLLRQLEMRSREESFATVIVRDHFDLLLRRRVPELSRKLSLSTGEIHEVIEEIAELDPAPGRRFSADQNQTVAPDAQVEQIGGEWVITTNDDFIPRLRISKTYKDLIAKGKFSSKEKEYVKGQMRAGKFLINSIEQRQSTIKRIASEILQFQSEFFGHGVSALKPLTMATVAEDIGVHETTVSRAIANKYLATPHGVFPFKYFFTPGYVGRNGDLVSNTSVKEIIGSIIEQEDPVKPLSDRKIVDLLAERDIKLARRTVAKYREELGILPTNLRRRY